MVELRKRKTPPPAPVKPAKKKAPPKATGATSKVAKAKAVIAKAVTGKEPAESSMAAEPTVEATNGAATTSGPPTVGQTITLEGFGGEIETNDGVKTTLAKLVEESAGGVVLFTYPKASTPGCTNQACLFRDSYTPLTATGYSIYGLSTDSPKANTTFKNKQNLPYALLCDPSATLISAIGLAKKTKGTTRGVFVVDKSGEVLAVEAGGPQATVDVVKKLVGEGNAPASLNRVATEEDKKVAAVAGEVADTAEKLDSNE
ncbi:AhpC-TSA-domain-containing protein [Patellaria atrata CBS 101060]|uniref:thioredoxin-dependent peroxiredoxin n=1 Tax=Patellaria atrata CBS 101060 TaxID=1346257 RepID=A0A9P4VUG1_9PEZI|nr:AhpC-TSA-domain-containing protein [Patellaria atrata CBS 101060]